MLYCVINNKFFEKHQFATKSEKIGKKEWDNEKGKEKKKMNKMRGRENTMMLFTRCLLGLLTLFLVLTAVSCLTGCHSSGSVMPPAETPKNEAPMVLEKGAVLAMDYNLKLEKMIAAGDYDWQDPQILDKFTYSQGVGVQEAPFVFARPLQKMSSDEVESYLQTCGLRSANLAELLALGAQYPAIQQFFTVCALNLPFGDDYIPYLSGGLPYPVPSGGYVDGFRYLGLLVKPSNSKVVWTTDIRILAIYLNPADAPPSGGG